MPKFIESRRIICICAKFVVPLQRISVTMTQPTLYTVGHSNQTFEDLLKSHHVQTLVDVRISNSSQLAGFAKGSDLIYFLKQIGNIGYRHITDFAPTKELLSDSITKIP